jgi:DNA repair exonuclease SbcCD ATPase subunit
MRKLGAGIGERSEFMIILKHLTVERFRLLRELNIHFPQRGSILVQGPNESGKSALLECIYFALYGEALATPRGKRSLDDLISYGASSSTVSLSLSLGTTDLTITRTLERGGGQSVCLLVHRLGMPEESPITRLDAANERIVAELGLMNGEALRNSSLIEQKGLERLEQLSGAKREATVRKLLGLEKFSRLTEQFTITPEDERLLRETAERLRLAEIQTQIPELSKKLAEVETALDAIKVAEDLSEIVRQEDESIDQEKSIEQIKSRRFELKNRQHRIQQLKRADATLSEIIAAYDGIAEARREIPELEKQIAELERREQEELPALEKRVSELSELLRSFGTLQRMSNDLLTAVDTIKDLEQELKQHDEAKDDLKSIDDQVTYARERVQKAQQALQDLEERRRAGRPQLEARLARMQNLADRLSVLRQTEDQYLRRLSGREQGDDNRIQLNKVQNDLGETEHELELVEIEARQAQQQADAADKRWRYLAIRRQIEEWLRLEGLSQGLAQAEQQVRMAYQHQEKLNLAAMEARSAANKHKIILVACITLFVVCLVIAGFMAAQRSTGSILVATATGVAAVLLIVGAAISLQNYGRARDEEKEADKLVQEAISKVGMMVAARETAVRMAGSNEARLQIEHEIRSLGGSIPRTLEEAQSFLQQTTDQGDSLADLQQQAHRKREEANAARSQVNVTMEAVATLRKERARLEEQRRKEEWDNIEENLRDDQASLERLYQEITLLAGQEGLPMPSISERLRGTSAFSFPSLSGLQDEDYTDVPDLESLVENTIKATEREIAALDGKLDLVSDLASQVQIHQEALNVLLARQKVFEDRNARYNTSNPAQQIERAREQQAMLRQALQSLQDSLRQRVKPLGVAFGQAAISSAETAARKQLEELQINLGNKFTLQERLTTYNRQLRELQESLAEHYKQLAKFSNTLGSWIVPPKPFAEALIALRNRCQRELEEANEPGIAKELEALLNQEGAAKASIELCHHEVEEAQKRIEVMLTQHGRSMPKAYTLSGVSAVWPLLKEYTVEKRPQLLELHASLEKGLNDLEQQELSLSKQLQTGNAKLDLVQARQQMEQQERSYQTRKRGNQLIKAVDERLLQKVLPRTERYMQRILPLLTGGRYHDVEFLVEPEEGTISGGPFNIQVWDSAAGEYVSKGALSAGTSDLISLALRLAFAIATLPRELNTAPGFVLLDEPLSSFDRGRARALVDVVNGEVLSQHFEQIVLISHSGAFDPTMFPYHIYMENGLVLESNLPVVPGPVHTEASRNGTYTNNGEDGATQMRMPAISLRKSGE